jgi:hypothetical protein
LTASLNVKIHGHANGEVCKGNTLHSMGMEIDFAARIGFDKPVAAVRKETYDAAPGTRVGGRAMVCPGTFAP